MHPQFKSRPGSNPRVRPTRTVGLAICLAACLMVATENVNAQSIASHDPESIVIDAQAPGAPFPHFWEQMFGSGRAILSLRESYRNDLRAVKEATDFRYIRFHAIFDDEVGLYNQDANGNPIYYYSYIDQIYDGLLANGVRPFVELSFMPQKLHPRRPVRPSGTAFQFPAARLGPLGRPGSAFCPAPRRSLRHRGSFAVVF